MAQHQQIILRPGQHLTPADLQRLRENTLALLRQGYEIPVLPRHDVAGSVDGGPQYLPVRAVNDPATAMPPAGARRAIGRLIDLLQLPDGALGQVIELDDENSELTFTSPELRPSWTDPTGKQHGPILAHIALTDRPASRGQTPLMPVLNEDVYDFSTSYEGEQQMKHEHEEAIPVEDREDVEVAEPEYPETDVLTDDIHEVDTVLAEEDVVEAAKARAVERSQLAERIRGSRKLPKGLRDRLSAVVETLQLSDEADVVPSIPVAEAVAMIEAAIPENLQFGEGELRTPPHPRGEGFFSGSGATLSDDDAQRIAAEQLAAQGFGPRA